MIIIPAMGASATKACPTCGWKLAAVTPIEGSDRGHAIGLCGHCNVPFMEGETCRPLTAEERAIPEIRRGVAVLRHGRAERMKARPVAALAVEVELSDNTFRPARTWARERLGEEEGDNHDAIMALLGTSLLIHLDHVEYRPGSSDATIAATLNELLARDVRAMAEERKLAVPGKLLAQAIKKNGCSPGQVAEVRGQLGLPLRAPIPPGLAGRLDQTLEGMRGARKALRHELRRRLQLQLDRFTTMAHKIAAR